MSLKIVVLMLVAGIAMAKVEEFGNDNETPEKKESANDEEPKMVMEDMNTETSTALVQNDAHDPDSIKNKGLSLSNQACSDLHKENQEDDIINWNKR